MSGAPSPELLSDAAATWPTYRRLLRYSWRYWPLFAFAVVGMIVDAACTAGFTALLRPLMDEGFLAENLDAVRSLPLWVVVIFLGRGLGSLVSAYAMTAAGRSVIFDMRQDLFEKMLDLPSNFYDRNAPGQLISKLTFHVEQVANASTDALTILVRDSLYVLGFVAVMLYNSVQLTLAVLLLGPVLGLLAAYVSRRFRKLSRRIQNSVGDVAHRSSEVIQGHQVVKSFGAQGREKALFRTINEHNRKQHLKLVLTKAGSTSLVLGLAGFALAGIIYYATSVLTSEGMTAGAFIAFITAMLAILPSLRRLTNVLETVQKGVAAAENIFTVLDTDGEPNSGRQMLTRVDGAIEYDNVRLAYSENDADVLRDVSFRAQPRTTTAIVGRSGSGKTSLVHLLPRFYLPTAGRILLDGVEISDIDLGELRSRIAVVGQHIALFNDTVAGNIAYGRMSTASREAIVTAARRAGALEFIEKLPGGFDTILGAEGIQLSGGQRQRIAIARAMLQDAPILILDEATSALDAQAERDVYAALDELRNERTTLVIAHRLSTIEAADQVLVMEDGQIMESGTHHELLKRGGRYASLHRLQFSEAPSAED